MEHREYGPEPKDISTAFLEMDAYDFDDYLRSLRKEPHLSIIINWKDVMTARRLKAFLENAPLDQIREAAIKATEDQKMQELNVFGSGVRWIPAEKTDPK